MKLNLQEGMRQGFGAAAGLLGDSIRRDRDMEDLQRKTDFLNENERKIDAEKWARIKEREGIAGTAEHAAKVKRDFEVDSIKRKQSVTDLRAKGTRETGDGYEVLGDDGKVRRTDKAGNLIGGPVDIRSMEGKSVQDIKKEDLDIHGKELSIQATKVQIANAAAAAADRSETKANKKALREKYALLGHYLKSQSDNPKGDYSDQITSTMTEIAALDGDPTAFTNLLLGKPTEQKVATKEGDSALGTPEVTTTKTVAGPRAGGVINAAKPAAQRVLPVADLIAGAKARGYSPEKIRETLTKNGYTEEQLKSAGL